MAKKTKWQYVEDRPRFEDLYNLRVLTDGIQGCIRSLADEGDTAQRATDLLGSIEELLTEARLVLLEEVSASEKKK